MVGFQWGRAAIAYVELCRAYVEHRAINFWGLQKLMFGALQNLGGVNVCGANL